MDYVLFDPQEDARATNNVITRPFRGKKFIVALSPDHENCKKLEKDTA
jgi:hypothetical protein